MPCESIALASFTLCDADPGTTVEDVRRWRETAWLPATVPGGVHEALRAAGRLPDPYWDRNEADARWVEDRDWWFRTTVPAVPTPEHGRLRLICHGLDTVADLWLDGEPLGHSENMFRPAEFDLSGRLAAPAELLICFRPPLAGIRPPAAATNLVEKLGDALAAIAPDPAEGQPESGPMSETLPLSTARRKATFSWGWDFGPRLPSIGPWRPIELRQESIAVLTGHHVRTDTVDVDAGTAEVTVVIEADLLAPGPLPNAEIELVAPSGTVTTTTVALAPSGESGIGLRGRTSLRIDDADLWWTHDLGAQSRYDLTVRLRAGDRLLDSRRDRVGLRTVVLDRGLDPEGGRRFRFVLNGVPIFARGAAWLPADMLVGSVPAERYRDLLRTARDGEMTMLRIWGGGIYERRRLLRRCATSWAMLVWQDFTFACMDYPDDDPHPAVRGRAGGGPPGPPAAQPPVPGPVVRQQRGADDPRARLSQSRPVRAGARASTTRCCRRRSPNTTRATPYWPGSPYGEATGDEERSRP